MSLIHSTKLSINPERTSAFRPEKVEGLTLIGTNYKYADLKTREKFAFSKKDILSALGALMEKELIKGGVILSTCQRMEIYAQAPSPAPLKDFLLNFKGLSSDAENFLYIRENEEAVFHLFFVSAGLDSQMIGENEILHQVKEAYLFAKGFEATTPLLNRLFERALFVGKIVRHKTEISKTDPSVAQAAVALAEQHIESLGSKHIFIIGAGTMAQGVARNCAKKGARCIVVANRTLSKALDLALEVNGRAVDFEEFYKLFGEADILFSATASKHLILKKDVFEQIRRSNRKLVILDLALPRDIDPAIGQLDGVTLFNLDDFKQGHSLKDQEILKAMNLVKDKAHRFLEKERRLLWKSVLHYA